MFIDVNKNEDIIKKIAEETICKDLEKRWGFDIKPLDNYVSLEKEELDKIKKERMEWGYDSICLRVQELVHEAAISRSKDPYADSHKGDYDYWKRHYANRAIRIYQILDDLLEEKAHGINH